jgi:hypothetical protein
MLLEVVNKHKLSTMRVARVLESKGGRLRLKYENSDDFDDFYCSELSELIHPIGWSAFVGHDIIAPEDYKKKSATKFEKMYYEANECSPGIFKEVGHSLLIFILSHLSDKKLDFFFKIKSSKYSRF